jgi:hypothetical protein
VAYLADIYDKINMIHMQFQGDNFNLIKAKNAVSTFIMKLELFKHNIGRRIFFAVSLHEQYKNILFRLRLGRILLTCAVTEKRLSDSL